MLAPHESRKRNSRSDRIPVLEILPLLPDWVAADPHHDGSRSRQTGASIRTIQVIGLMRRPRGTHTALSTPGERISFY